MKQSQLDNKNISKQAGFGLVEVLLTVLVLVLLVGASVYIYHRDHKAEAPATTNSGSTAKSTAANHGTTTRSKPNGVSFQLPDNWSWYTNTQYGFKLAYPNSWGTPSYISTQGNTGTEYKLSFYPDTGTPPTTQYGTPAYKSRDPVMIQMDSDDYSFTTANDSGNTGTGGPAATSSSIQSTLANLQADQSQASGSERIVAHSTKSYSVILTNTGDSPTDLLDLYQIVNLPKINVSAVFVEYQIFNAEDDCAQSNFSANSQQWCINQDHQDLITQVADSIQEISP